MPKKLKIDQVDDAIDAITAAYPEDSSEYTALHDIQLLVVRTVTRNLPAPKAATKIKQLLDTHRGNPALHRDLLQVLGLALSAIDELLKSEEIQK